MYCLVCFILLVSLEGLKANQTTANKGTPTLPYSVNTNITTTTSNTSYSTQEIKSSPSQQISDAANKSPVTSNTFCTPKPESKQTPDQSQCLFNILNDKEKLLYVIILFLLVICLLLLVIMCFVCICCCRRVRKDYPVEKNSYATTKRNSVNGGPSETDIMLKDCSSVRVEIETTPDESQESEEVGGATAKVEDQVSGEENKKSANDTSETAPTQEADQAIETEVKMEDLEKAE